jgi:hypothetical protein
VSEQEPSGPTPHTPREREAGKGGAVKRKAAPPKPAAKVEAAKKRLGDAPVQERYREQMVAMIRTLDEFLNEGQRGPARKTGIVVLVFPFGEGTADAERCNFISNGADRRDLINLFKEMIARWELAPEATGHG